MTEPALLQRAARLEGRTEGLADWMRGLDRRIDAFERRMDMRLGTLERRLEADHRRRNTRYTAIEDTGFGSVLAPAYVSDNQYALEDECDAPLQEGEAFEEKLSRYFRWLLGLEIVTIVCVVGFLIAALVLA